MNNIDRIFEEEKCFETSRLVLVPTTNEDFVFFKLMFTNKKIMEYSRLSHIQTEEQLLADFKRIYTLKEKKYMFMWKIVLKETGQAIGRINLASIVRSSSRLDIGYVLLPEYWGVGIMSEAIIEIISYLFRVINIHKITARTNNSNNRSKRLLYRLGFELEGVLKESTFYPDSGIFTDDALFGLLNKKFHM